MRTILCLFLLFSFQIQAQESAPSFVDGVQAYESKDYQKSQTIFSELLSKHPDNPVVLYNLGLAEYNLGKKGLALGLWRKARFLQPRQGSIKQAVEFVESELFPDSKRSDVFYIIYSWLKKIPLSAWLTLSLLTFCSFFWNAISLTAKRKIPFTQWPYWQFLFIPLILFSFSFSFVLIFETMTTKATVVASDTTTRTGPSETAPTLSTLSEGELITIKKKTDKWAQIRTMTGAPGWIELEKIIILER